MKKNIFAYGQIISSTSNKTTFNLIFLDDDYHSGYIFPRNFFKRFLLSTKTVNHIAKENSIIISMEANAGWKYTSNSLDDMKKLIEILNSRILLYKLKGV